MKMIKGQEREPLAPAQSALQAGDERREAGRVDTQAWVKGKIMCKQKFCVSISRVKQLDTDSSDEQFSLSDGRIKTNTIINL